MKKYFIFLILFTSTAFAQTIDSTIHHEARLLRFPAIHQDKIVFSYAGDLYTVSSQGGMARKLTSDIGYEMFARFSPDGKQIAFTGQYDGNTEVYLIPAEGGIPKRLTYTATLERDYVWDRMGPNNIVMTWKNDGQNIVFRSRMREWNDFNGQLYTVSVKGDLPQQLPLPRGGFCSFSPDDKKMAYNRVFREFRTWKKYRGGMADDVWIYDFETKTVENITSNPAQDIIPMWHQNKIYFASDRDENERMNLYVYDLATRQTKKLTNFTNFDIKWPSLGEGAIVFENAGYIYKLDLNTESYDKVPITISNDMLVGRSRIEEVSGNVTNYEISPDGNRALFGAHGDVFTVPAKHGPTRNITATSGVHERNSKWSPDGKWIAYISDQFGENEIYIKAQDGSGKSIQITNGADTYYYQMYWSPDSKKLLWGDKKLRLRYVDVSTKKITEVAQATAWEIRDYSWSPDSKWVAYSQYMELPDQGRQMRKIYLYSLESGKTIEVTGEWYASDSPAFSSDGKYLYFVSERDFNPIYSETEWDYAYEDMAKIYLVTLSKDVESPFKPKSDEVTIKTEEPEKKNKKGKEEKKGEKKEVVVKVDPDGLKDRIAVLPVKVASYGNLVSVGDYLYYIRKGSKDEKPLLLMYNFKDEKEEELGQVDGYEISADKKKILVSQNRSYYILDLPKGKIDFKEKLNLSGMEIKLNRHSEWEDIFEESWRQMRDFFYAPNMNGLNWEAVRQKYAPLVKYVNHRSDLTYIIGEMIGELNSGHTYVGGGDTPDIRRIKTGLLGAELERDPASKYYRIKKILSGENWDKTRVSPLTEIGVSAKEGDYILAVNGEPTNTMTNFYESMINTAGKQVVLKIHSSPTEQGSREVTVIPVDDERQIYYYDWVQNNIEKVNEATNGKVGYIHIPDMGTEGLNEFAKRFYPQLSKKALIIDVRGNGGGNVSPMIIDRLRRDIVLMEMARNTTPTVDPGTALIGPLICIADEFSASDGDIFTYRFKKHKLGKVVGKRTWGGVVGIRGTLPLLDGGYLRKPEFAPYDPETDKWVIEGHGVEPDIYVDNDPAKEYAGIDQQLNKAIEVIMDELRTKEFEIPPIPPYPIRVK
jgi:tricorn protease